MQPKRSVILRLVWFLKVSRLKRSHQRYVCRTPFSNSLITVKTWYKATLIEKEDSKKTNGYSRPHDNNTKNASRMPQDVSEVTWKQDPVDIQLQIPVEVWQTIFALACLTKEGYALLLDSSYRRKARLKVPPIIISHVCSRWRDIAISSPFLWSTIAINLSFLPHFAPDLLRIYLENSKQCLLDIRIHGFYYDAPKGTETTWGTLVPHLRRCSSLFCSHLPQSLTIPEGSFPNLTTLEDTFPTADTRWQNYFQVTPKLTSITTSSLYPYHTFPYSQLTSMEFRYLQLNDVETLIKHVLPPAKSLESLTVGVSISRGGREPEGSIGLRQAETLPVLRKLVLSDRESGASMNSPVLRDIVGSFKTPTLITLQLECAENCSAGWSSSFFSFLTHASTSLRHFSLTIRHSVIPERRTLSRLLELVPNLTEFRLKMRNGSTTVEGAPWLTGMQYEAFVPTYVGDLFLDLRVTDQRPAVLVPKLTYISVSLPRITLNSDTLSQILDAAESRVTASISTHGTNVQSLGKLSLACRGKFGADRDSDIWPDPTRIQSLMRKGVQIAFEDLTKY
ncbi:hypothetical protein V5O48_009959 [Marasmius crinis-equi]|uniref:F-box domain-containing protein n=1 Tax=Marasmius crinis-equi TaxID=585013 RepID=A0ABR3F9Q3_9AGAR